MTTKAVRILGASARSAKRNLIQTLKSGVARRGFVISRIDDDTRRALAISHNDDLPLPAGAANYLRPDNPKLAELESAYANLEIPAVTHTQWRKAFLKRNLTLTWFRGDNAFVWQFRQMGRAARLRNYLALLDIESNDRLGLFERLSEDGLFGCFTFEFGERPPVSRDLMDSINEINYLDAQMGLSAVADLKVLDIGAGYGRLAHRMSAALPNLAAYDCIDGVATSTFLCDYYTRFRGLPSSVRVVRLDQWQTLRDDYDVAVNIHSWSECPLEVIRWWLDCVAAANVQWLLIVPNTPDELRSIEADGSMRAFRQEVLDRGYELVDERPIHPSDELRPLIGVLDRFYLFKRKTA